MADEGLDVFRIVADRGTSAAAARALNKDPSCITRMIKNLEEEYDTQLFDRGSKPFTLTESGLFLVNMIDNGLSTEQKLKRFVEERSSRQIKIGYSFPFSWHTLSRKMSKLKMSDPDIMFHVNFSDKTHIRNLLFENQLDLAVLPDKLNFRDYKIIEIVSEYEWGVAVPSGVPITDKQYVEPYDLEMYPLLVPIEQTCKDAINAWFGDDVRPLHADTYNSIETMIGMMSDGFGYAFVPKADSPTLGKHNITFYPCNPKIMTSLYVYTRWRKDMSDELKSFLLSPEGQII